VLTANTKYGCIIADPPWAAQAGGGQSKRGADRHYPLMSTSAICALQVPVADEAVLFLWSTWNTIPDALQVMRAWGFRYVSGLPWVKVLKGGDGASMGLGQYFRACSEPLLFGTRGVVPRLAGAAPLGLLTEPIISRKLGHSRKPETVYDLAEHFEGPYLEMFARKSNSGWSAWGNEVLGF